METVTSAREEWLEEEIAFRDRLITNLEIENEALLREIEALEYELRNGSY